MSNFHSAKSIILKDVRVAWLDAFRPGNNDEPGSTPKFKVRGIFPRGSEAHKLGGASMLEAAQGIWKENAANVVRSMAANSKAIRNGDDNLDQSGAVRPEFAGQLYVSASSKQKPKIVGPKRITGKHKKLDGSGEIDLGDKPTFVDINEDGTCSVNGIQIVAPYKITVPYRGCRANIKIQMTAGKSFQIDKNGKKETLPNQVYAKLEAIQFLRDDEAFGAGPSNAEGFDDEAVDEFDAGGSSDAGIDEDDLF